AFPPEARTAAAVSSASAREPRAWTITEAPAAASSRAMARPMFRAAPVTRAVLPLSSPAGSAMVLSYKKSSREKEISMLAGAERVRVFWQPGCTSCLRTKEFLTRNNVDYESINVHGNEAGMEELRKLGA